MGSAVIKPADANCLHGVVIETNGSAEKYGRIRKSNVATIVNKYVTKCVFNKTQLSKTAPETPQILDNNVFMDSVFVKCWLSQKDADDLFTELSIIGESIRPKNIADAAAKRSKYPLWTKYYGLKRNLDGSRALDRWGSFHESWIRVEEPCDKLKKAAELLEKSFQLNTSVNSMVVNYYFDGDNTYIPAHRDTTACLADGSRVYCLSLGASRDFVLCDNSDAGQFDKAMMSISREWRVGHGDLVALGPATNEALMHAVTREPGNTNMRISVIFRTIDKSFIDLNACPKEAVYSDGTRKEFRAECIATLSCEDPGTREHLADLITEREREKKTKTRAHLAILRLKEPEEDCKDQELRLSAYEKELLAENRGGACTGWGYTAPSRSDVLRAYYLGFGSAVPVSAGPINSKQ